MPATKTALGEQAYIWSAGSTSGQLMISAHGGPQNVYSGILGGTLPSSGDYSWYPEFTCPPNMKLHFYGPHNQTLLDPSYLAILKLSVGVYETVDGGQKTHNYGLWKWQGYHHSLAAVLAGKVAEYFVDEGSETYDSILTRYDWAADQSDVDYMDLLSIRYRPTKWHTSLADIIKELEAAYPGKYQDIHCVFCRGILGGHDARTN